MSGSTHADDRVKLPKTFLAVNLSDAFSFQEKQQQSEGEGLEMKTPDREGEEKPEAAVPVAVAAATGYTSTEETTLQTPKSEGEGADGV
jgi:hypothetical protein